MATITIVIHDAPDEICPLQVYTTARSPQAGDSLTPAQALALDTLAACRKAVGAVAWDAGMLIREKALA